MISKKFITSSFIYSVVGSLPLASSIVLLPFYTNMLSTSDFGMLMVYIIFSQLIQIFFNFGLDNFVPINYIENKDNPLKQKQSVGTAVFSLLILGLFIIILFSTIGSVLFNSLNSILYQKNGMEFYPWGFMSVITAFFNSFFKTYTNLLIYQQRAGRFLFMNLFNFIITIVISVIGIYIYPYTLIGPMWGRLLSGIAIFFLSFYMFSSEFKLSFNKEYIKPIFNYCFPYVLFLLIIWVVGNIDRYIILYFMSPSDVAVFDFAIKATLLIEFFQNGLAASTQPKIFNIWKEQNINESTMEVNRYYNGYTAISLLILPLFIVIIPIIVPLFVYNADFYKSFVFLSLLTIGFATRGLYNIFLSPLLYFKKTSSLPKAFLLSAIFQIVANILLIKQYGLMGAVWTSLLVKYIQILFLYLESRKIFKFKFNLIKQIFLPLIYTFLVIFTYFIVPEKYTMCSNIILLMVVMLIIFSVYKNEIKIVMKRFL